MPPKGISTVPDPAVESKRSVRPLFEQTLRSAARVRMPIMKLLSLACRLVPFQ